MTNGEAVCKILENCEHNFIKAKDAEEIGAACRTLGLSWEETIEVCDAADCREHWAFVRIGYNEPDRFGSPAKP